MVIVLKYWLKKFSNPRSNLNSQVRKNRTFKIKINMKQYLKLPGLWLCILSITVSLNAAAQAGEGFYGPVYNSGTVSHGVGTGANAFSIFTGGNYDGFTNGTSADNFVGPNGVAGAQEIGGITAPIFDTVKFNNGVNLMQISNTAGIVVNGSVLYNNGITTTVRTNRTAGLAGAIQFTAPATYTPALTPIVGSADVVFTDGYVSKVNPTAFVYPVGNVTDLRPITATGVGTFIAAWSNVNLASTAYTGTLSPGILKLATNGYWEWNGTAAATAMVSIPDETSLATPANLWLVGYNGSAWVNLGGVFTSNTENSSNTTPVAVAANITAISVAQAGVIVNAKVFLQGDMPTSGTTMRNDLQNYYSAGVGLLPSASPFGNAVSSYINISNLAGTAGAVADWIQVEVRLASNTYATAVETRSLLLKPNGTIVDSTGLSPTFNPEVGTVRLVIKSRNHMAIMSKDISSFAGTVSYDFTTSLAQAANAGDPAQMIQVNGVWTMISGDLNGDNIIDAADGSIFKTDFVAGKYNNYMASDLNMDGLVDAVDGSYFKTSFLGGNYSTILNY